MSRAINQLMRISLTRRMTRLARLYAARDRRRRMGHVIAGRISTLNNAINRTKMPANSSEGWRASVLLSAARRQDMAQ